MHARYCVTLLLLLIFRLSAAALPATLSYQGYLTDDNGAPVNTHVIMTFNIYNVSAGGVALWSDKNTVIVQQGLFSTELGGGSNPLPPGLFDTPLWIGVSIESDAEMTPRRPITAAGFAFKADDADTLEGNSASALDQSAHVANMNNPHHVTAAQTGAADASSLAAHIADISNPHSVTTTQIGAATSKEFTLHTADSSAHHARYNDSDARLAMGIRINSNPLNHNRFSDANAVSAILAADGPGSGLDADMVDGLEASEIIDAAQDEVRTPISSLPFTINAPGSYYLTGNLDGSGGGITINADDITLDLTGFAINGGGTAGVIGIDLRSSKSVTIKNGGVKGFGGGGITQSGYADSAFYVTLIDLQAIGNGNMGIHIAGKNHHIERCIAASNAVIGILAGDNSKLIDNTSYSNGTWGIRGGYGSILTGNTVYDNGSWGIYGTDSNLIKNNNISANNSSSAANYGGLRVASDSSVIGNLVTNNNRYNIDVQGDGNVIENNQLNGSTVGLRLAAGNFYANNRAHANTYSFTVSGDVTDGGGNYEY